MIALIYKIANKCYKLSCTGLEPFRFIYNRRLKYEIIFMRAVYKLFIVVVNKKVQTDVNKQATSTKQK